MNPFAFLVSIGKGPDYKSDDTVAFARRWAENLHGDDVFNGDLVLNHALRQYEIVSASEQRLDDKFESVIKLASTLAALLVAVFNLLKPVSPGWWIGSFVVLLVAIAICIRGRSAIPLPRPPAIANVIDGIRNQPTPRIWLAAALHKSVTQMNVAIEWKARLLHCALWLVFVALCLLLPLTLTLTT